MKKDFAWIRAHWAELLLAGIASPFATGLLGMIFTGDFSFAGVGAFIMLAIIATLFISLFVPEPEE